MQHCLYCCNEVPDDVQFCTHCGAKLANQTPENTPYNRQFDAPPAFYAGGSQSHPYQQLGGVLRLFQVFFWLAVIFLPFGFLGLSIALFMPDISAEMGLSRGSIVVALISAVFSVAALIPTRQLLKRKPQFFVNYHYVFILSLIVSLLSDFILQALISHGSPLTVIRSILTTLVSSAIAYLLYRTYITRSVRVRTYLGTDAYITENPFTKHVTPIQPAVPDVNN
jgi:hypothetical protein